MGDVYNSITGGNAHTIIQTGDIGTPITFGSNGAASNDDEGEMVSIPREVRDEVVRLLEHLATLDPETSLAAADLSETLKER